MSEFQELQHRHLALLAAYEQDRESKELLANVQAYIDQVVAASRGIGSSRERNQLRANLRFWGAYVYDHTSVYPPNLTLLPSEKAPPASRRIVLIVGGIVLILIVLFIAYLSLAWVNSPQHVYSTQTNNARLTAQAISAVTFSKTPTPPPTGTTTETASPPTPTSPPLLSPTPTPLETSTEESFILTAVTGGGGPPSNVEYDPADCSGRTLKLDIYNASSTEEPLTVTLFRSGTGEVVARQMVSVDEYGYGSAKLSLANPTENTTYLLDAKNSVIQYQLMILQFLSNCTRNNTVATLGSIGEISEQPFDSQVVLLAWGGDYTKSAWLAEFKINNGETGIFWLVDHTDPSNPVTQPINGTFRIKGYLCASAYFELVETTGGIYRTQEFSVFSPMSFCP